MDRDKLLNWALKSALTLIAGAGLNGVSGAPWFGRIVFRSFADSLNLTVLGDDLLKDDAFSRFSREVIFHRATPSFVAVLFFTVAALLLLAHVLYRRFIQTSTATPWETVYSQWYFHITLAIFIGLPLVVFYIPQTNVSLLLGFMLQTIPAAIYLFFYSSDIKKPSTNGAHPFMSQLTYLIVLIVFLVSWPILPSVYGARFFDMQLPYDAPEKPGVITLVLDRDSEHYIVCRVYFDEASGGFNIEILNGQESPHTPPATESLRHLVARLRPPVAASPSDIQRIKKQIDPGLF